MAREGRPRSAPSRLEPYCSIRRALDIAGEKWSLLILREAFYGVRRFDDFQRNLDCARNVLSDRLATLVGFGLLAKVPYREPGHRERLEYRLTDKGIDLFPVLTALMEWGDRWAPGPAGPPVELRHRGCDALVRLGLECENGHRPVPGREIFARLLDVVDAPAPRRRP